MLTITLKRNRRKSNGVFGTMVLPLEQGEFVADTIENADFLIPAGKYPLRLTWSPRFKKLMPLIDEVPEREGIEIIGVPENFQFLGRAEFTRVLTAKTAGFGTRTRVEPATHMGTKPEHSQGCVLVSYLALENLKVLFNQRKKWYDEEEMQICIVDDYPA